MTMFYSPTTKGFYDEAVHGPRMIDALDQPALDKAIKKATHGRKPESIEDEAERAEVGAKVVKLLADPPMRKIENPECQIPGDAIELSRKRYEELLHELSHGRVMEVRKGELFAVDPTPDIEEQIAAIRRRRDRELRATDWTQVPDALVAAKRELWAEHRQALRDLPAIVEEALKAKKPMPAFPEPPGR
jgi:hypothetical protein